MSSGFLDARVVQVHPTLRCNLACTHCYSSSSPRMRGDLSTDALIARLERLRREGYDVVSFSGGEPLMYGGFDQVAVAAKAMGFRINAITNGLLLTPKRVARLSEIVSVLGLSLDGSPARHDRMRGLDGAFRRLAQKLPLLREHGIPFGFSHCVTTESIEDLPWLLEYALEQGARLLQLHPLTMAGRATAQCGSLALSEPDLARVFLISELLRLQADGRMVVQLDIAALAQVLAHRTRYPVLELADDQDASERDLADLINPLVIDELGTAMPLAYGMGSDQHIASGPIAKWNEDIDRYKSRGALPLRQLLNTAFSAIEREGPEFVDWYGRVTALSQRSRTSSVSLPISA